MWHWLHHRIGRDALSLRQILFPISIFVMVLVVLHMVSSGEEKPVRLKEYILKSTAIPRTTEATTEVSTTTTTTTTPSTQPTTTTNLTTAITEQLVAENVTKTDWVTPLQFLHEPKEGICRNVSFFAMVRIKADDFTFRTKWRKTFGRFSSRYNFSYAFLISLPSNASTQIRIENEIQQYHDILQCNHVDAYMNVTYKTMCSLRYASESCDENVVMMKIDDDIFFNFTVFQEFIPKFKARPEGFMCSTIQHNRPSRDNNSIWYVPMEQFDKEFYPTYCDGSFFFIKQKAARSVMEVLPSSNFFWVDDVFVTGVLREKANVGIISVMSLFDLPYIQSSQNNAFAYFARSYPEILCSSLNHIPNCISDITTELEANRKLGPKKK